MGGVTIKMNNSFIKGFLYSSSGSAVLYHSGKQGMHWHIRNYQPYDQGYHSQSGGVYVGPHKGLFGKLFSKGKGVADYYKTNGLSDLKGGAKELASRFKNSGYGDTIRQLSDFGKRVGKSAKDTAIPFLKEAGSELGKKAKKGLITGASYGIYGAQELGKMAKEQINKGKSYLDAFSKTGTGQELVSRIMTVKKGAKNALDSGINAATSVGASFLSMYLGGPKGRSYEEYTSPKAKTDLAYGVRTLSSLGEGKVKSKSKNVNPDYESWFRSEYSLSPIDQEQKYWSGKTVPNMWKRSSWGSEIPHSTETGRERALDRFTKAVRSGNTYTRTSGSSYDRVMDLARDFGTTFGETPEKTRAKQLLNQLTTLNGGRTIDSVNAERSRKFKNLLPYTSQY